MTVATVKVGLAASDVFILFNGFLGMSGGDRHLLDMAWYWSDLADDLTQVALPRLAERVLAKEYFEHMRAFFIESPFEKHAVSSTLAISLCYAWRIIACSVLQIARAPKIVIASGHMPFDVIPALILCRRYRAKLVIYIFHLVQAQARKPSLRTIIARLAENLALHLTKRYADLVVTDNPVVCEQLVQLGVASDRIRVTPLGVSVSMIRAAPSAPVEYHAVFLGRLVEHKGIYDLVNIWEQVVTQMPDSRLLIIGEGSGRTVLAQRFKEKHLDGNVEFAGLVNPQQRVYELLKQCRLCLHPSHEEGWGISICEAMACGLPIVAYDLPAYRSVFRQGMVTAPLGDHSGLAQHVIRVLKDEALHRHLRSAAIQQAAEYDVVTVARDQWKWLVDQVA